MEESPALAAAKNEYTFGDNSRASARLRRLAWPRSSSGD
jgi:hypothetical protein